ncbi:hypothetical protein V7S43_004284 [Phytophthora oleae]|uniref:M96 mating-specific protein family n=1 Tax=Phytophthora oleae TaxID=2107226 RepID=A0ABD3FVZ8_9STRA
MPQARVLHGKKRSSSSADVHEHEHESDDSAQSTAGREAPARLKKKRGYRKALHAIRKEEITRLQVEITQLQSPIRNLQHQALAPKDEEDEHTWELSSNVLQNLVKKQQSTFVNVQAAMSSYTTCSIQCGSPIQRTIVLPNEELPRREILRSMKTLKLKDARRFMRQRLAHLTPTNALSEERRFESDAGDYWAVRFTTTPFESARSVKQVFDLVIYFLSNSEIAISEKVGHLTVREDGDNRERGIVQNRLVSMTGKGLHMETNSIIFHEYWEAGTRNEDAYGLIVSEFADADERHPYRPDTRIRKDASIVMEVRAYPSSQQEKVVVLTLWSHSHLRRPSFPVPKDAWHELRENVDRWSQNMHKNILETMEPSIQEPAH